MTRNGTGVLRIVLAALLFGSLADAQGGAEADGAVRQAIEYERDYDKALRLLQEQRTQLLKAKTETHPQVSALDAKIAEVRKQKSDHAGVPQDPTSRPATTANSFVRRAWDLAEQAADELMSGNRTQITSVHRSRAAALGSSIVPSLVKLLDGELIVGQNGSPKIIQPAIVAQLLVAVEDPSADAVVEQAMRSSDPVIRLAMAGSLSLVRHRKLVDAAIASTNKSERTAALGVLCNADKSDAAAAAALSTATREGHGLAAYWMVKNRRTEALAMLTDKGLAAETRSSLARSLGSSETLTTSEEIKALLSASNKGDDPLLDSVLLNLMDSALGRPAAKAELMKIRAEAETWLLARIGGAALLGSNSTTQVWAGLASIASLSKLEAIYNGGPFEDTRFSSSTFYPGTTLHLVRSAIEALLGPSDFAALVALLPAVQESLFEDRPSNRKIESAVLPMLERQLAGASDAAVADAAAKLQGTRRDWLLETHLVRSSFPAVQDAPMPPRLLEIASALFESSGVVENDDSRGVTRSDSGGTNVVVTSTGRPSRRASAIMTALNLLTSRHIGESVPQGAEHIARIVRFVERNGPLSDFGRRALEALQLNARHSHRETVRGLLQPKIESASDDAKGNFELTYLSALNVSDRMALLKALLARARSTERTTTLLAYVSISGHSDACPILATEWTSKDGIQSVDIRRGAVGLFESQLYLPALPLLRSALTDTEESVRAAAQKAFKTFKANREALEELDQWKRGDAEKSDAITELTALLDSKKPEVVIGAVRSLGALKAKAVLPKLVRLLERDEPELKAAVNEAITKIGS